MFLSHVPSWKKTQIRGALPFFCFSSSEIGLFLGEILYLCSTSQVLGSRTKRQCSPCSTHAWKKLCSVPLCPVQNPAFRAANLSHFLSARRIWYWNTWSSPPVYRSWIWCFSSLEVKTQVNTTLMCSFLLLWHSSPHFLCIVVSCRFPLHKPRRENFLQGAKDRLPQYPFYSYHRILSKMKDILDQIARRDGIMLGW